MLVFELPAPDVGALPAPTPLLAPLPVAPLPLLVPLPAPFDAEHAATANTPSIERIDRLFISRSNAGSLPFDHNRRANRPDAPRSLGCAASG